MSSYFTSMIPDGCEEKDASAADYQCKAGTIGFRVNSVTAGSSVRVLTTGSQTVTFDNLSNGEDIVLHCSKIIAAGTDCDSIHLFYLNQA